MAGKTGRVVAALFVIGQLAVGAVAIERDLRLAFGSAPYEVIGPGLQQRLEAVQRLLPGGEPVLVLLPATDAWYGGLWHRGLYPRTAFVLEPPYQPYRRIARLCARQHVRFAIVLGPERPEMADLPLRNPVPLPPEPGHDAAVLAELAP